MPDVSQQVPSQSPTPGPDAHTPAESVASLLPKSEEMGRQNEPVRKGQERAPDEANRGTDRELENQCIPATYFTEGFVAQVKRIGLLGLTTAVLSSS